MPSVYIHIPFCERICHYCDFPKRVSKTEQIDDYLTALYKEVTMYDVKEQIDTLYLGGGTPSLLNANQLVELMKIIDLFRFNPDYEFTIECNPEHITVDKVIFYKKMGVNRISLGVQTFNNQLLKILNRGHDKNQVIEAINRIKECGIHNISIDLIYAIPLQTIDQLKEDLEIVRNLGITHISAYSLILEEKTVFDKMHREKKITLIDNELEAEMYKITMEHLKEMGFNHYEISNYAMNGYESKHNQIYWKNKEYYGFGMGASGYLNGIRYYNEQLVNSYIQKINRGLMPIKNQDALTQGDQIKEEFLLGLRLLEGVHIKDVNEKYHMDVLDYFKNEFKFLIKNNWIIIDHRVRLSKTGLFYGNEVFELFI